MPLLGVNIDHVATLRQARRGTEPSPVEAAVESERAGCDSIVCHLREDRRHIQDADLRELKKAVKSRLNLEMSVSEDVVKAAVRLRPDQATIVPERRQEVTTEGGLSVVAGRVRLERVVAQLKKAGIQTSFFIDPDRRQIEASRDLGVSMVEFHTGRYANAWSAGQAQEAFDELKESVELALSVGLVVNAGHGLNYKNVSRVAAIPGITELNIGHSIISRAVFVGLRQAVREMVALVHRKKQ